MSGAKLFQRKSLNHELKTEKKEVSKVCWKVGLTLFNSLKKSLECSTELPKKLRLAVFRDFALNTPEAIVAKYLPFELSEAKTQKLINKFWLLLNGLSDYLTQTKPK